MIITIDGPAGAGKSSAARALAQRLGFDFLDTGAMYRAVAVAGRRAGTDFSDEGAIARLLGGLQLEMPARKVVLNGEDVTNLIRSPEITALSRQAADSPVVRDHLSRLQRQIAAGRNIVTEGRDQGTVVFPQAECKFFLNASPQARAERRYMEMRARGERVSLEDVLRTQKERDLRDAERAIAPMMAARDAILIDSSSLKADQVVDLLEKHVRSCMKPADANV